MSDEQSIRDEIAMILATWRDGGVAEEWSVDMYREPADLILASPVIRRIQAEAWDEGVRFDRCVCAAWDEGECACGRWGTVPKNPYRGETA